MRRKQQQKPQMNRKGVTKSAAKTIKTNEKMWNTQQTLTRIQILLLLTCAFGSTKNVNQYCFGRQVIVN